MRRQRLRVVGVVACCGLLSLGAVSQAGPPEDFHEGYYLEVEQGDIKAAVEKYEAVIESSRASKSLRDRARQRLAGCREELATADFASLMPPETLAYIELSRPGHQLERLLDMLGLLGDDGPGAAQKIHEMGTPHVAVSPKLVRELLGIRGAAVALTGFNMAAQMPTGVAVIHPGKVDVIRGLIETGLPVASEAIEAIDGLPTYLVEKHAYVCLTSRLLVVGTDRPSVEGVVRRLRGQIKDSMLDSPGMEDILKHREDALGFACVNAQRIVPMLAMAAAADPEFAMASTLLDLRSLKWVAGRFGVSEEGVFADLAVQLDEGHHNLAYNLIRTPPIQRDTLAHVPRGVAALFAAALSDEDAMSVRPSKSGHPHVTGLDIGREIFANIQDFVVYAMTPQGDGRSESGGMPIPDVAAVIRVHDPSRSEALWREILGIASLCTGAPTNLGQTLRVAGVDTMEYQFPEGVKVYVATSDDKLLVSLTKHALQRALKAADGKDSVLDDPAFAASIGQITNHTSKVVMVHPGRLLEVGRPFMSPADYHEATQFADVMTDLVGAVMTHESADQMRASVRVSGLPKIDKFIAEMIAQEQRRERHAHTHDDDRTAFQQAAQHDDSDDQVAPAKLKSYATVNQDNPNELNNAAWELLTGEGYTDEVLDVATRMAERACQLTDHDNWAYLDTLALARFKADRVKDALRLQRKAVELRPGNEDLRKALERYEKAANRGR